MRLSIDSCCRLLAILAAGVLGGGTVGAATTSSEQAVHAAMLYNFLKFSEWPAASDNAQLKICLATGDPEQIAAMEALKGQQVRGKTLITTIFRQQKDCNVIYVDSPLRWQGIADNLRPPYALTIGSYAGFAMAGGMIEIAREQGSVRFDINLAAAKHAGLHFYPQLLKLARRILE